VPDSGLDYWLTKSGHSVTNISAGSASNFGQLRQAYWTLKQNADFDFLVWFHTESFRDIIETVILDPIDSVMQYPEFTIDDFPSCQYVTKQNYNYAQMIYKEFDIPFIVIGGQSPVDPAVEKFDFAHHVVTSWLQELLELDVIPPANTFFSWNKIKVILDHYKIDEKTFVGENFNSLTRANEIAELAQKSCHFPDNCHPSRACFKSLADRILDMIRQDRPDER